MALTSNDEAGNTVAIALSAVAAAIAISFLVYITWRCRRERGNARAWFDPGRGTGGTRETKTVEITSSGGSLDVVGMRDADGTSQESNSKV